MLDINQMKEFNSEKKNLKLIYVLLSKNANDMI